ncbi:TPA: hypothetical protein ACKN0D_002201, partial [Neisseria gonorrhoeae]
NRAHQSDEDEFAVKVFHHGSLMFDPPAFRGGRVRACRVTAGFYTKSAGRRYVWKNNPTIPNFSDFKEK